MLWFCFAGDAFGNGISITDHTNKIGVIEMFLEVLDDAFLGEIIGQTPIPPKTALRTVEVRAVGFCIFLHKNLFTSFLRK